MTKDWKKHQATILNLYKVQGKTLNEVMKIMEKQHAFKASTRAYRSRFDRWGIRKYNKSARKLSTMAMPARLPQSVGPAGMLRRTDDSRSPSIPASMMVRSYSGPLSSSSSVYTPELSYSQLKPDPYIFTRNVKNDDSGKFSYKKDVHTGMNAVGRSNSPVSSASPQNRIELHQRLVQHQHQHQHQQYYAQPVQHNPHLVPIDGVSHIDAHYQGLEDQQSAAIRDDHFVTVPHLRQDGSGLDKRGDDCLNAFQTLLENPMPPSHDPQRVQIFSTSIQRLAHQPQLNERRPSGSNAIELYIQNYLSRDSIRDFCQLVASFVRAGADTSHIIPPDFSNTVILASEAGRLQDIDEAVRQHQQQGVCAAPTCAAVWASACIESLKGNGATADAYLSVLPFTVAEHCEIDIQALSMLLPTRGDAGVPPLSPESDQSYNAVVEHAST